MWRFIGASVVGTSHIEAGAPPQDECFAELLTAADGSLVLVCAVADGAGSATEGARGAELAVLTVVQAVEEHLKRSTVATVTEDTNRGFLERVRAAIRREADEQGRVPRDYACTLLCAVIGERHAACVQVGDGAIVAASGGAHGVVFWPAAGPYANMTHFVCDDDAQENVQSMCVEARIDEVALFSDGLQRLALSFANLTPHAPFFDPMLAALRAAPDEECPDLEEQLRQFLGSAAVNQRTDDDKSLILATRRAP